jgi:hypothetical protein
MMYRRSVHMHAKISFHSETTQNITVKEATAPDKMGLTILCLCVHATDLVTVASHYITIRYNISLRQITITQCSKPSLPESSPQPSSSAYSP